MPKKSTAIVISSLVVIGLAVLWINKEFWLDVVGQRSLIPSLSSNNKTIKGATKMSWAEGRAISKIIKNIKIGVAVHYSESQSLPRDLQSMELPKATSGSSPKLRILVGGAIEVLAGGRPNARIYFIPQPTHSNPQISWSCISPDIIDINYHIAECRFDQNYKLVQRIKVAHVASHRVLFKFDKAGSDGLSDYGKKVFTKFIINMAPSTIQEVIQVDITGYTDPIGSTGRNIKLADSRVAYVREIFAKLGIKRERIITRVIGIDPKPIRKCPPTMLREERIECYAQSRRVDIKIKYKKDV